MSLRLMMDPQLLSISSAHKVALFQINEKLEDLRLKLNEPTTKLTNDNIVKLTTELQPLYKKMIIYDLEGAIQRQLDTFMWNDCFKTPLTHFGRNDMRLFDMMIESGVAFYLGFIQDIGMYFDIGFIKNNPRSLYCTAPVQKTILRACPSKSSVYYIIQNSLIHVGDLLRYRGSFLEALKMYEKSTALSPSNGHPFHQMGLVQVRIDNKTVDSLLAAVYYYARAVSVTSPFITAQHNLDNLLAKLKSIPATNKLEEFTHYFLAAVANPESVMLQSSSSPSLVTMLSPLITNGSINTNQLFRIIVVGLWSWRRESSKSLLAVDSSSENCVLEIIAAVINSLLIAAVAYPDLTTFYALAHLKILMDWLRVNSSVLNNPAFRAKLHTQTLCKFFNQLLTLESNVCGLKTKEMENIILSEEKRLLGFLPFCRTYEHLNCVMEDTDGRAVWIRIYRTLKCADSLAQQRLGFMERSGPSGLYSEIPLQQPSVIRAPNRRNVAFQSIFNQLTTEPSIPRELPSPLSGDSPHSSEPGLPVSSKTHMVNATVFGSGGGKMDSSSSYSYYGQSPVGPSSDIRNSSSNSTPLSNSNSPFPFASSTDLQVRTDFNSPDFSQLFCSIWTPLQHDTSKTSSDGWEL